MGYSGRHAGNIYQQNLQAGKVDITTDASGNGTASVTFGQSMKKIPVISLLAQEADTTGTLNAISISASGFTAKVSGSSVLSGTLTLAWIAFEDSINNPGSF